MKQKGKILVDMYLYYKKAEEDAKRNRLNIIKELAKFAPHKVGDVVKWTERKIKNVGSTWHPNFIDLPPVEKKAVVYKVEASVCQRRDKDFYLTFNYEFRPIKKDGGVSQNQCYLNMDIIEWTGEVYDLNKE